MYFDNTGSGEVWKSNTDLLGAAGVDGVCPFSCLARAELLAARSAEKSSRELSESESSSDEFCITRSDLLWLLDTVVGGRFSFFGGENGGSDKSELAGEERLDVGFRSAGALNSNDGVCPFWGGVGLLVFGLGTFGVLIVGVAEDVLDDNED